MHAFLIVGATTDEREAEIVSRIASYNVSDWDVTKVTEVGTVGIEEIRNFVHELSLAPRNSPAKIGLIHDVERLTTEAQNALLKTLEEPPPHTYILGSTGIPEGILPTIRSRMTLVRLAPTPQKSDIAMQKLLNDLLAASPGKKLQLLEPYETTRDDAKNFIASMLAAAQEELVAHPSKKVSGLIRNLLTAQSQLSVNVNQKLVVDNIFLSLP